MIYAFFFSFWYTRMRTRQERSVKITFNLISSLGQWYSKIFYECVSHDNVMHSFITFFFFFFSQQVVERRSCLEFQKKLFCLLKFSFSQLICGRMFVVIFSDYLTIPQSPPLIIHLHSMMIIRSIFGRFSQDQIELNRVSQTRWEEL